MDIHCYTLLMVRSPLGDYARMGLDPTVNILLGFEKTRVIGENGRRNAPHLYGASGGGIWRLRRFPHPESKARLAAIGIEWVRDRPKAILGTYLGLLLQELHNDDPRSDVAGALRQWARG
jgi:hypothetical protein